MKKIITLFIMLFLLAVPVSAYEFQYDFTDTSNNPVDKIEDMSIVKIKTTALGSFGTSVPAKLYITVFDESDRLVYVNVYDWNIYGLNNPSSTKRISGVTLGKGYYAKVFVWNENQESLGNIGQTSIVKVSGADFRGICSVYETLTGSYSYEGTRDLTFSWLYSDTETGAYAAYDGADSAEFTVPEELGGKYVKFRVSDGVTISVSDAKYIEPSWRNVQLSPAKDTDFLVVNKTTPDENVFNVGGIDFVLLDTFDSDSAHYFAAAKTTVGMGVTYYANYDVNTKGYSYENMSYYLNNSFVNDGFLPDEIIDNMDRNKVWKVSNNNALRNKVDHVKGGVGLLSQQEIIKYSDKLGLQDSPHNWWTRSSDASSTNINSIIVMPADDNKLGTAISENASSYAYIKPAVYLNKDFFGKVCINLEKSGENIKKMLFETYSRDELLEIGYDLYDVEHYYDDVCIEGLFEPYQTLTAFTEHENVSSYQWMNGDTPISGATGKTYTVPENMAGKTISVKIKLSDGSEYTSVSPKKIDVVWKNLRIDPVTGEEGNAFDKVQATTPGDNIFTVEGIDFVLLDVADNGKYLVMSKNCIGDAVPYNIGSDGTYISVDFKNMSSYLNSDEFTSLLPQPILGYIDNTVEWQYENNYWLNLKETHCNNGGIAIPSIQDVKKYASRMGLQDDSKAWWLRTPMNLISDGQSMFVMPGEKEKLGISSNSHAVNNKRYIRPMFYIDAEFFANEKIEYAGDSVLDAIYRKYTLDDLTETYGGIYTEEEIVFTFVLGTGYINPQLDKQLYDINSTLKLDFDVNNHDETEYETQVYWGDELIFSKTEVLIGKHDEVIEYPVTLKYGVDNVRIKVTENGEDKLDYTVYDVICKKAYERQFMDSFATRGVCGPVSHYTLLRDLGARVDRPNITWSMGETTKGEYSMTEQERKIPMANGYGIDVMAVLAYGNSFYNNGSVVNDKATIDGFVAYAVALAEKYPYITNFEIWNEPNDSGKPFDPYNYTNLAKITEKALKKVNPDAVVSTGVVADSDTSFPDKTIEQGILPYTDAFSTHHYAYGYSNKTDFADNTLKPRLKNSFGFILKNGGWRKNFVTEFGVPTEYNGVDYQAREIVKEFIISDDYDVDMNLPYMFADDLNTGWGLIKYDGTPKKTYIATESLFEHVQGSLYIGRPFYGNEIESYLYAKDGEPILAMWSTSGDQTIDIGTTVSVYDMYNNLISDDTSILNLNNEPVYVMGLPKTVFSDAVSNIMEERIDRYLGILSLERYKSLFENTISNAVNKVSPEVGYEKHFDVTDSIISLYNNGEITYTECMGMLYTTVLSGKLWMDLYAVSSPDAASVSSNSRITDLQKKVDEKASELIGGELSFADAMLKTAKEFSDDAITLRDSDENGQVKQGVINAWDMMANKICDMVEKSYLLEEPVMNDIIVLVPMADAILEYNKTSELNVTLYNYSDTALKNAEIRITDSFGNVAGKGNVSINANSDTVIQVQTYIPDGGANDSTVTIELIADGKVIGTYKAVVMKQLEKVGHISADKNMFIENTPDENVFTVDGQEFILLDVTDDAESKYMVMSKKIYGPAIKQLHNNSRQNFDINDTLSLAYWLNNSFRSNLPDEITSHIDENHYYTTEGGSIVNAHPYDYQTKCGIAVLSSSELMKYREKFGIVDGHFTNYQNWYLMLRTGEQQLNLGWKSMKVHVNNSGGTPAIRLTHTDASISAAVRPIFYLDENFFDEENVTSMGSAVKDAIK